MNEFLLGAEVARRLRVSRRTVTAWLARGILTAKRDSRGWAWFALEDIERLRRLRRGKPLPRKDRPRFEEVKG
jgi:DNA-binding transcriptional MerR regulator